MKTTYFKYGILIAFSVLLFWSSCQNNSSKKEGNISNKKINSGEGIYKQYCVTCHGINGKLGLNGAADFTQKKLSRTEAIDIIKNGKNMMAPYREVLSEKEVGEVTDYVLSFSR